MEKRRDLKLDIIRIFSLFCVISVHFFLNSGYYQEQMNGKTMIIMTIIRAFFIICVPMFIVLTGYLMNRKELSKSYYKGVKKTLIIYFICSIVYHIFIHFYYLNEVSFKSFIKDLLWYQGTKYSWYIEMYIGLFLMIPFLNIVVNNLKSKKDFNILLITLLFLIGIPNLFNALFFKAFPSWWSNIYPIFYYFLGAYLFKYNENLSKNKLFIFLIILIIVDGLLNYYVSYNNIFVWSSLNDYGSFFVMLKTYLVFSLLLKLKVNYSMRKEKIIKRMSDACLGAYLISCIFDIIFYDILNANIISVKMRFIYAPVIVLAVFICSIILSMIIDIIYDILFKKKNIIR